MEICNKDISGHLDRLRFVHAHWKSRKGYGQTDTGYGKVKQSMWFQERVFYQIYPLNFCGAPNINRGQQEHRLEKITTYMDRYLSTIGIGGIYFNPVFSSDSHGYDTRDHRRIDERLGTNSEFRDVVDTAHRHDIKIVIDGVFNHVGRGFFAFKDLKERRENSRYRDWFHVDFQGDSPYHDGFWYEGWEGHYELVRLNLHHPEVQQYLLESIGFWIDEFGIDGIRLDVAYLLPDWFMAMIREYVSDRKTDFFLLGETLSDNQDHLFSEGKLDAITDFPLYKSIWSGFNSMNMFEIAHTMKRTRFEMYRGRDLWTFLDNHDVDRIASKLGDTQLLPVAYGLLLALPGIPCIYYGSEWGIHGDKTPGKSDDSLRPAILEAEENVLSDTVRKMIGLHNRVAALRSGRFEEVLLTNRQYVFTRTGQGAAVLIAVNIDDREFCFDYHLPDGTWQLSDSKERIRFSDRIRLDPKSVSWWIMENTSYS